MMWSISPQELREARKAADCSSEELAEMLEVSPALVADWEAGVVRVPFAQVRQIRFALAVAARSLALRTARDLPRCEWAARQEKRPAPRSPEEEAKSDAEWDAHIESCSACQQWEVMAKERFPVPEAPQPLWFQVFNILMGGWLPEWAELSVPAAIIFALVKLARDDVQFTHVPGTLGTVVEVGIGALLGAAIGFVWSVVRYTRDRTKSPAA